MYVRACVACRSRDIIACFVVLCVAVLCCSVLCCVCRACSRVDLGRTGRELRVTVRRLRTALVTYRRSTSRRVRFSFLFYLFCFSFSLQCVRHRLRNASRHRHAMYANAVSRATTFHRRSLTLEFSDAQQLTPAASAVPGSVDHLEKRFSFSSLALAVRCVLMTHLSRSVCRAQCWRRGRLASDVCIGARRDDHLRTTAATAAANVRALFFCLLVFSFVLRALTDGSSTIMFSIDP